MKRTKTSIVVFSPVILTLTCFSIALILPAPSVSIENRPWLSGTVVDWGVIQKYVADEPLQGAWGTQENIGGANVSLK
jgi:hypothetical protein